MLLTLLFCLSILQAELKIYFLMVEFPELVIGLVRFTFVERFVIYCLPQEDVFVFDSVDKVSVHFVESCDLSAQVAYYTRLLVDFQIKLPFFLASVDKTLLNLHLVMR